VTAPVLRDTTKSPLYFIHSLLHFPCFIREVDLHITEDVQLNAETVHSCIATGDVACSGVNAGLLAIERTTATDDDPRSAVLTSALKTPCI
jgi:hypothetical protein